MFYLIFVWSCYGLSRSSDASDAILTSLETSQPLYVKIDSEHLSVYNNNPTKNVNNPENSSSESSDNEVKISLENYVRNVSDLNWLSLSILRLFDFNHFLKTAIAIFARGEGALFEEI